MRNVLDDLDPLFMGTAVAIACLNLIAHMPNPPLMLDHPPLDLSMIEGRPFSDLS